MVLHNGDISRDLDLATLPIVELAHGVSYAWLFDQSMLYIKLDSREFGSRACVDTWMDFWEGVVSLPQEETPRVLVTDITHLSYTAYVFQKVRAATQLIRKTRVRHAATLVGDTSTGKLLQIMVMVVSKDLKYDVDITTFERMNELQDWVVENAYLAE